MNELLNFPRETWLIVRVDGTVERRAGNWHAADVIESAIGASVLTTVSVGRAERNDVVMFVDDVGIRNGKKPNPKATALYHAICRPGTTHEILGDVALIHDDDFA